MLHGSAKHAGYPLHTPVAPSFPLPHVTVHHHILIALYVVTEFVTNCDICSETYISGHTVTQFSKNV
jgi:hypothetical protein